MNIQNPYIGRFYFHCNTLKYNNHIKSQVEKKYQQYYRDLILEDIFNSNITNNWTHAQDLSLMKENNAKWILSAFRRLKKQAKKLKSLWKVLSG